MIIIMASDIDAILGNKMANILSNTKKVQSAMIDAKRHSRLVF